MKRNLLPLLTLATVLLALMTGATTGIAKTLLERIQERKLKRLDKAELHRRAINKSCDLNCKIGEKCCATPGNGDAYTYCSPVCRPPNQEVR